MSSVGSSGRSSETAPVAQAETLFNLLLAGCEAWRNQLDRELNRATAEVKDALRSRIHGYLEKQTQPGGALADDKVVSNRKVESTLSWMLYVSGRLCADGNDSASVVLKHADPKKEGPWEWVQYWALAGLARARRTGWQDIARRYADHEHWIVKLLAKAMLAREGDTRALQDIRTSISTENSVECWAALRAMRVCCVEDEKIVTRICEIIRLGNNSDLTYDALKAAYHVERTSPLASDAALALIDFVQKWRDFTGRDAMRAIALLGLGKLKAATAEPTLLAQLTDSNPTIVREAARSLESVLGSSVAVRRVLEKALGEDDETVKAYADALRQLENRTAVATALSELMVSGSAEHQKCCYILLSEVGGAEALQKLRMRNDLMSQYQSFLKSTEDKIETLFDKSLTEAQRGFRMALSMDLAVFLVGLSLLIASAVLALFKQGNLSGWAGISAGTGGAAGILGTLYGLFVAKPREQVARAVNHLMSLKVVFLAYLRQLFQSDQAYVRYILEGTTVSPEDLDRFAQRIASGMNTAIESIARLNSNAENGTSGVVQRQNSEQREMQPVQNAAMMPIND